LLLRRTVDAVGGVLVLRTFFTLEDFDCLHEAFVDAITRGLADANLSVAFD
jgi:hypothetical protein